MSLAWNRVTIVFRFHILLCKSISSQEAKALTKTFFRPLKLLNYSVSTLKQYFIIMLSAMLLPWSKWRHNWKYQELTGLSQFLPQVTKKAPNYREVTKSWGCNSHDVKQHCGNKKKVKNKKTGLEGVTKKVLQVPWLLNFCKLSGFSTICGGKTKVV